MSGRAHFRGERFEGAAPFGVKGADLELVCRHGAEAQNQIHEPHPEIRRVRHPQGPDGAAGSAPSTRKNKHRSEAISAPTKAKAFIAMAMAIAIVCAMFAPRAAAQGTAGVGDAYSFAAHAADPGKCSTGNVEFNLTSATPKFCSAPNTWTAFGMSGGGGGGVSGTVNSGAQFALGVYAAAGTAIGSGPTPPATNGQYFCGYDVMASAAVAPSCWLNSLTVRAVAGSASTDTILFSDVIVEYKGSAAVATALPTPATLGNSGFYARLVNTTSGSATAVTVTAASPYVFSSTGTATLGIAQGRSCSVFVDPAGNMWDDVCGDMPMTAGANVTITRGQFGPTISASAGLPSGTSGQLLSSTGGTSSAWVNQSTVAAGTAAALAATPTQCSGAQFATGVAASGNANCATPAGSSFSAASAVLFDDFVSNNALSALGWAANGGGGSVQMQPTSSNQQAANHPGIAELNSGGSAGGTSWEYYILGNQNNPQINPTANSFTITADLVAAPSTAAAPNGTTRFGIFDSTSMNQETPSSGIYFEAVNTGTSGAANWNCVVNNAGTPTSASSGVAVATGAWNVLSITFNSSTSASFSINGTAVCGSLSASITSKLYSVAFDATDNAGGAASELIDYAEIAWNLTR